jgi:prolyl oligopeptidase
MYLVNRHELIYRFTFGALWISEYGSPDDEASYKVIRTYSPLHNVNSDEKVIYPATLLTTAEKDTRVVPAHSLKFAATLQGNVTRSTHTPYHACNEGCTDFSLLLTARKSSNPNPLLLRVYRDTGHGLGKTTKMIVDEALDRLSFIGKALDLRVIK